MCYHSLERIAAGECGKLLTDLSVISSAGGMYVGPPSGSKLMLTLSNCKLLRNTASVSGGGIYALTPLTAFELRLQSNVAALQGGGLYHNATTASLQKRYVKQAF
jgi:hypothetical protein